MNNTLTYDAIIVGAGHNGLTTAAYLAKAGWRVLVLERNDQVGGAVRSGEATLPGFTHDLYSMNQNLFLGSPVYQELKEALERHGLRYRVSDKPYCNVFPDGSSLRVYTDVDKTLSHLREHNAGDADGFERLYEHFKAFQKALLPLYYTELPSLKAGGVLTNAVRKIGMEEVLELGRLVLSSTRELGEAFFETEEMRALVATWGMHLDFGPDVSGGAQFPLLEVFSDMEEGMAIAEGGASKMPEALVGIIREHGGEVRTNADVARVLTQNGKATGVELAGGEQLHAERAVVANLTPTLLFERLLPEEPLPDGFRRRVKRYSYGPGTMMVHLALKAKPRWAAGEEISEFAYVHIPPYVDDLAQTYTDSLNGQLPESPLLIVGQPTAFDKSRTPGDEHILWIQVRTLPFDIKGDAAGHLAPGTWDDLKEPYADRVMAKLEHYAPGIQDLVLARTVYSPADLEAHNPNLHHGDSVAGSHHLKQNFLFRPLPGWSTYKMPVENLLMVGASTWPGGGTNAGSGYLAAQDLLKQGGLASSGVKKWLVGGAVGAGAAVALGALFNRLQQGDEADAQDNPKARKPEREFGYGRGEKGALESLGKTPTEEVQVLSRPTFWALPLGRLETLTGLAAPEDTSAEAVNAYREKAWNSYALDLENKMEYGTARQVGDLPAATRPTPEAPDGES